MKLFYPLLFLFLVNHSYAEKEKNKHYFTGLGLGALHYNYNDDFSIDQSTFNFEAVGGVLSYGDHFYWKLGLNKANLNVTYHEPNSEGTLSLSGINFSGILDVIGWKKSSLMIGTGIYYMGIRGRKFEISRLSKEIKRVSDDDLGFSLELSYRVNTNKRIGWHFIPIRFQRGTHKKNFFYTGVNCVIQFD